MDCNACATRLTGTLLACGQCKAVYYCNEVCQRIDWTGRHHVTCAAVGRSLDEIDEDIAQEEAKHQPDDERIRKLMQERRREQEREAFEEMPASKRRVAAEERSRLQMLALDFSSVVLLPRLMSANADRFGYADAVTNFENTVVLASRDAQVHAMLYSPYGDSVVADVLRTLNGYDLARLLSWIMKVEPRSEAFIERTCIAMLQEVGKRLADEMLVYNVHRVKGRRPMRYSFLYYGLSVSETRFLVGMWKGRHEDWMAYRDIARVVNADQKIRDSVLADWVDFEEEDIPPELHVNQEIPQSPDESSDDKLHRDNNIKRRTIFVLALCFENNDIPPQVMRRHLLAQRDEPQRVVEMEWGLRQIVVHYGNKRRFAVAQDEYYTDSESISTPHTKAIPPELVRQLSEQTTIAIDVIVPKLLAYTPTGIQSPDTANSARQDLFAEIVAAGWTSLASTVGSRFQ